MAEFVEFAGVARWVDANGLLTREAQAWIADMVRRVREAETKSADFESRIAALEAAVFP